MSELKVELLIISTRCIAFHSTVSIWVSTKLVKREEQSIFSEPFFFSSLVNTLKIVKRQLRRQVSTCNNRFIGQRSLWKYGQWVSHVVRSPLFPEEYERKRNRMNRWEKKSSDVRRFASSNVLSSIETMQMYFFSGSWCFHDTCCSDMKDSRCLYRSNRVVMKTRSLSDVANIASTREMLVVNFPARQSASIDLFYF